MTVEDLILVWGEAINPNPPAGLPTVSVSAWSAITGKPWLKWQPNVDPIPPEVFSAKVALINVFWGDLTHHIELIRHVNPLCYLIAAVDPSLDMVLAHPEWTTLWRQLKAADMIAGRTPADNEVYGSLFGKPTLWLPSPIGPTDYFAQFRDLPKGDYLLTLDHQFAPNATAQNLAAVALAQRELGLPVIYFSERDHTRELANLAGLDIDFRGHIDFKEAIDLTARAWACLDLYASHSYGRQGMLCAMVGTPCVNSKWCLPTGHDQVDPFYPVDALFSLRSLRDSDYYQYVRKSGFEIIEQDYSLDASRKRLTTLLEQINENHMVPGRR